MTTHTASDAGHGLLTVCGGRIDDPEKFPVSIFQGRKVYFCHSACLRAFKEDPQRFMAGEIEHPAEDDPTTEVI